jgi:hypothetical protein
MAIDQFIPEIWSAGVTQSFISSQVVIPTLNTLYQGDASRGNQVHIINATTPTIVDYAAASRSITAEALADTEVNLLLNQEKAFSVFVDDIDKVQAAGTFNAWTDAAGKALAEDAETYLLAQMIAGATNGNAGAVVVDTADEAKTAIRSIRTAMTAAKVPSDNRFCVVTPDFADLLIQGLTDVSSAGSSEELRNGMITRLFGMTILESPLLGTDVSAVGYHGDTVAFVNQIQSLEALRSQTKFSDIVRGLNVYGAKVIKSEAVIKYVSA